MRLAHTLALALDARQAPAVTLVARGSGGAPPVLAWIGTFDAALRNRIEVQAQALEVACASLRYVSPEDVESACERLGANLVRQIGRDELERAELVAIPNGGPIVLDRLAPHLRLKRRVSTDRDSLLVVVDDCAISGARFRQFLARRQERERQIVFAPLFSPPALREAILATEPRVLRCLSGEDVREIPAAVSAEHQDRRLQRLARNECFWLGATERLCFPWNEPDQTLWNPWSNQAERAWRIVPPELCSKNLPAPGARPIPVQIQSPGTGSLRPSDRALFADLGEEVALCDLEGPEIFRLAGVGSDLWKGLLRTGDSEATIAWLRGLYDVPEEDLRRDAQRFFEVLGERGLIASFQEAEPGDLLRGLAHRPPVPFDPGVSQQAPVSPEHADPQGGGDSAAPEQPSQTESLGQTVGRPERSARGGPGRPETGRDGVGRSGPRDLAWREPALDPLEREPAQTDLQNLQEDPGLGKSEEALDRGPAPRRVHATVAESHREIL